MASTNRSSRSSSARGRSARGPQRPATRSSGGSGPTVIAAIVVVGAIVLLVVLLGGRKKDKPQTPPPPPPTTAETPRSSGPQEPVRLPPPPLPPELKREAAKVAQDAKALSDKGEKIYEEAIAAKRTGNDELWQEKLKEASGYFHQIQDAYNDLIGKMPANDDWDEEQVANHYLGNEADAVRRAVSRLTDIRKQRRN